MATWLNDPLWFTLSGVIPSSIVVEMSHPDVAGPVAVYDGGAGGWQTGFSGTLGAGGSGGVVVSVTTIPATLPVGLWTVTVTATAYGGATGGGYWSFWLLIFAIEDGDQKTLNAVDIVFSWEPKHIDPADPDDGINRANYVVTGPVAPFAERLLQAVSYEGDDTLRLWFDGPLVPGEVYSIQVSNVQAIGGAVMTPDPTSFSFTAFDTMAVPIPLEQQPAQRWDLSNPQTPGDAPEAGELGTFQIDDTGDLSVETQRKYLRKRVYRRITTQRGSIMHLPEYGVRYDAKALQRTTSLRRLQLDIEAQVGQEPDVLGVRATVQRHPTAPGVVKVQLRVRDIFGPFELAATIGGE